MSTIHRICSMYIFLSFATIFISCKDDEPQKRPPVTVNRTVLAYIISDKSLDIGIKNNLTMMEIGMTEIGATTNSNLIVYFDSANDVPILYRIDQNGRKEIKRYPEQQSANKENMKTVMNDIYTRFPAKSYGLILSSHGSNWLPENFSNFAKQNTPYNWGVKGDKIEIEDMISILPDHKFDFILFDCCFMGGIELNYSLRNKTKYIISSPTEILSEGFPYQLILKDIFSSNLNLTGVCESYFNFYNTKKDECNRSATIVLVETEKLENVKNIYLRLYNKYQSTIAVLDTKPIQKYYRNTFYPIWDFAHYVKQFATSAEYAELNAALKQVISYKKATPNFVPCENGYLISQETFCGLSTYIPLSKYGNLNNQYKTLEWMKN